MTADERLAALEAALKEIERQSDDAITNCDCDDDGCVCCAAMDDIDRRVAAALALTEGGS